MTLCQHHNSKNSIAKTHIPPQPPTRTSSNSSSTKSPSVGAVNNIIENHQQLRHQQHQQHQQHHHQHQLKQQQNTQVHRQVGGNNPLADSKMSDIDDRNTATETGNGIAGKSYTNTANSNSVKKRVQIQEITI